MDQVIKGFLPANPKLSGAKSSNRTIQNYVDAIHAFWKANYTPEGRIIYVRAPKRLMSPVLYKDLGEVILLK